MLRDISKDYKRQTKVLYFDETMNSWVVSLNLYFNDLLEKHIVQIINEIEYRKVLKKDVKVEYLSDNKLISNWGF